MRNVTGQVDLTHMKPAYRGSPGLWRVGSGRVRRISKYRGSGRVGSGGFQNFAGRVGSGRVKTPRNARGSGRVGSGQGVSKFSRIGSGQLTGPDPDPTREKPCIFQVRHGESLKKFIMVDVGLEPTIKKKHGLSTTPFVKVLVGY